MNTIDELMLPYPQGTIGTVRVCHSSMGPSEYFIPYFKDRPTGNWHGLSNYGNSGVIYFGNSKVWSLWKAPVEKVVRWKWIFEAVVGEYYESGAFYSDEEVTQKKLKPIMKLEYTRTEFDK